MTVDYVIIGQGLCGTWLSYYLLNSGATVLVIDKFNDTSASNVASGLINPVTGRRVVTTWMAEKLLPFLRNEYEEFNKQFHFGCMSQKNILVFPSAPDLHEAFNKRRNEGNSYIFPSPVSKNLLQKHFNFPFDVMEIAPCYLIDVRELITRWRNYLKRGNALIEDHFNEDKLVIGNDRIQYKDIVAKKIIYCNGIQATFSKYWNTLPFVPNKGQALIVDIPKIPRDHMYKFGHIAITPWEHDLWWIGSSNELEFETDQPTEDFAKKTTALLTAILRTEFIVKAHVASLRPATVERRPFVGVHPHNTCMAILNGMGSKGCSLAPWFAKELTGHLTANTPVNILADVKRYTNILTR